MSAVTVSPAPDRDLPPMRVKRKRWTAYILPVFTITMILYLASPVFMMIAYSFNAGPLENIDNPRQSAEIVCCTLAWWRGIFDIDELNTALFTSIFVALPAAFFATLFGTLIGMTLGRYRFTGRAGLNFVIFLAIAVPEIVLGSALLSMFVSVNDVKPLGLELVPGQLTITLSHIGFSIAFVAITVRARVQGMDTALESAAQDLYATPVQAFFKVTLPLIAPGIVAGFLLAFVLSLDDFVITNFVNGTTDTFPTWVYGASRLGVPPHVNVWGTLLFTIGILIAVANLIANGRSTRKAASQQALAGASST
jgi:spermidine/putrescine transport system permease protein